MARARLPQLRRPWPLRLRLTLAFSSAIAIVLGATAVMIHIEFARDLDRRVDSDLIDRGRTLQALERRDSTPDQLLALSGEALAQIYASDGRLEATSRQARGSRLLTSVQARSVAGRPSLVIAPPVVNDDDGVRVRGVELSAGRVAAIGESRRQRERSLHRLAWLLAIMMPAALALASLVGYLVAGAALRPVERMRARAAAIGESDRHDRLPTPGTGDELDRLARTLNDLLDRMHRALEHERRIVSDASHELRTPVAVLRTRLEVALRSAGDDPRQLREALAGALGDGERLSRLAENLLVLARSDQGELSLRREPLELQDLLEEAAERNRAAASLAGRKLEVCIEIEGGAVLDADADRVGQALDNLIANAVRYGEGAITLRGATAHDGIALVVEGDGPGFPPEFLARAFERFSQADASHGANGHGSGLGLAIVDAIARAHGGRAAVANRAEGGARATLVLPTA